MEHTQSPLDQSLNVAIAQIADVLPPISTHQTVQPGFAHSHFLRTGRIAIEYQKTPDKVFCDRDTQEFFTAWATYAAIRCVDRATGEASPEPLFSQMVADVLNMFDYDKDTARWLAVINAIVVLGPRYAAKHGTFPTNERKFVTDCLEHGTKYVMQKEY
ncbi:hypothetical protein [Pannonibacter sp. SL95]|uniref:hypothetical protein n=1 Tax=Pannonibacter sp. SL95 TaxID=2995153 RepID=UPI0022728E42|nr:hypothetical protein [Pannonibacter sp. SL95]MCY1708381.1 hypothetical protein [Pannonibacter sp. SL95]